MDTVGAWKDAGVRKVIVGITPSYGPLAKRQMDTVVAGGLELEAYTYLYYPNNLSPFMLGALDSRPVKRLWLDFEDSGAPEDVAKVTNWIRMAVAEAKEQLGTRIGIYTASWWWTPFTGNCTEFSDLPLWVAQYDYEPSLQFNPFGGWNKCEMKQYRGTTEFHDYSVDMNYYEEDAMTPELQAALAELRQAVESLKNEGQLQRMVISAMLDGKYTDAKNMLIYVGA